MRLASSALSVVLLVAAAPAGAKILDSSPSGFTLENQVTVPADAATAWKALVDDVERWWPRDHRWWSDSRLTIEARAGGCFCERAGDRQALHMQVTFVDPGRTLRLTGGLGPLQGMGLHGALEFRLAPAAGGGTTITMWYRAGGYLPANPPAEHPDNLAWFAPIVDQVQAQQLGGLGRFLTPPAATDATVEEQ